MQIISSTYYILLIWFICDIITPLQLVNSGLLLPNQLRIGLLLTESQYEEEVLFKWAIEQVNLQRSPKTRLSGLVRKVQDGDSWDAEQRACELLADGAVTIIGPLDPATSYHVGSVCDTLEVPHINIVPKTMTSKYSSKFKSSFSSDSTIDVNINRVVIAQAYIDLLKAWEWNTFVYVYEDNESLINLQEYIKASRKKLGWNIKIYRFRPDKPYRDTFWQIRYLNIFNVMIDVKSENLRTVLKHAQQVSSMTESHNFLIVNIDLQSANLDDFMHSKSKIIWLKLIDHTSESVTKLIQDINNDSKFFHDSNIRIVPDRLLTNSALIYDAVEMIAQILQDTRFAQSNGIICNDSEPWKYGSSVINYVRSISLDGMTSLVQFDQKGVRSGFQLKVMRLYDDGPKTIGNWTHGRLDGIGLSIDTNELTNSVVVSGIKSERDTLIVTSIKSEPYFMLKHTTKKEIGNTRYEGYAVDVIDELSRIVEFDYVFKEVDDGKYGKYDEDKEEWNGMIKEVMIGKSDLAIADLSITSSREDAVDFTLPFMNTGISILFKKPTTKELELFSFLSPFEKDVWIYGFWAFAGVSLCLFLVGRLSPYEWADPHPCRQDDKLLRNQFKVNNCFWFTTGALMQQGSDIAPRSLSTRILASTWYFFTLIMISSYTANLAAFLTVEKIVYPIERAEELYHHPQNIRYGCVESGSTRVFFEESRPNSAFRRMFDEMVFVQTNDDGKRRVEAGNYAFFMESASIEYTIERNCNLTQIGGLLDSKGYGIALAKNSTRKKDYRTKLSEAILSLQESGILENLKNRWWKEKRGGGACDVDDSQSGEGVKELTLKNVGGVFVVLAIGLVVSLIALTFEILFKSMKEAEIRGTTIWRQIKRRIVFSFSQCY